MNSMLGSTNQVRLKIFSEDWSAVKITPNEIIFTPENYKHKKMISVIYDRNADKVRDKFTITHRTYSKDYYLHALRFDIEWFVLQTEGNIVYGVGDDDTLALGLESSKYRFYISKYMSSVEITQNMEINSSKPTPLLFSDYMEPNKNIKMIDQGKNFSVVLNSSGEVFSWGLGVWGELGIFDQKIKEHHAFVQERRKDAKSKSIMKKMFFDYSKWSSESEAPSVYLHWFVPWVSVPHPLDLSFKVIQLSCGSHHVALLEESGKIYTFGTEENGRLGYSRKLDEEWKDNSLRILPRLVTPQWNEIGIEETFVQVSWGADFTLAISASNFLYSWGSGSSGIHWEDLTQDKWTLSKIETIHHKAVYVSSGINHWGFIDFNWHLFMWGSQSFGKLGNGKLKNFWNKPQMSRGKYISLSWGHNHTLAITNNYQLQSWGMNEYGELGHGSIDFLEFTTPIDVLFLKGKTIVSISAGNNHSVAVTIDGYVYSWGRNNRCQWGVNVTKTRSPWINPDLLGHGVSYINAKYGTFN